MPSSATYRAIMQIEIGDIADEFAGLQSVNFRQLPPLPPI
jgi:hypothetical protein